MEKFDQSMFPTFSGVGNKSRSSRFSWRKLRTLLAVVVFTMSAVGGLFAQTWTVVNSITELTASDVFMIVDTAGGYALPNNGGTSTPAAIPVTFNGDRTQVTTEVTDALKWNIATSGGGYIFYPNGTTASWLYCTNSNTGVKVGTNTNNVFTLSTNWLLNEATSRYVGVYTVNPDWRCYTGTDGNIKDTRTAFYKYTTNPNLINVFPYRQDFEATGFPPAGWTKINSGTREWTKKSTYKHSGTFSAGSGFYGPIYLVTPAVAVPSTGDYVVGFWSYNSYSSYYEKNSLVLSTTPDFATEVELWSPASVTGSWVRTFVDIPSSYAGQTIYFAFKYEGDNAHEWFVDDVCIQERITPMPTITPATGTYYNNILVEMNKDDFDSIFYTTDGTTPSSTNGTKYVDKFTIVAPNSTTIKAIGYLYNPVIAGDVAEVTYTYPSMTLVDDIAAFKALVTTDPIKITGDLIFVYRNDKYIYVQDAKANAAEVRGLMIYDQNSKITTEYTPGDTIRGGVTGVRNVYHALTQMIPVDNTPAGKAGVAVQPITQTVDNIKNDYYLYESRLMKIEHVTFSAATYTTGQTGDNMQFYDEPAHYMSLKNGFKTLNTNFYACDSGYLIGFATRYDVDYQLWPRSNNDFLIKRITSLDQQITNALPDCWDAEGAVTYSNGATVAASGTGSISTRRLDLSGYTAIPTITLNYTIPAGGVLQVKWSNGTQTYTVAILDENAGTNKAIELPNSAKVDGFFVTVELLNTNGTGNIKLTRVKISDEQSSVCSDVLVADGTNTNNNIPLYGYYLDQPQKTQMIYLDGDLTALRGREINKLTFYSSTASANWTGTITVSLGITSSGVGALSSGFVTPDVQPFTNVFTGILTVSSNQMVVTFSTNFIYPSSGGNLLLQFEQPVKGTYIAATFYGKNTSGVLARRGYGAGGYGTADSYSFLPKVNFGVVCPVNPCTTPHHITITNITHNAATISWLDDNAGPTYNLMYSTDGTNYTTMYNYATTTYTAPNNLLESTKYYIKLQTDCGLGSLSDVSGVVTFETLRNCGGGLVSKKGNVGTGANTTTNLPLYATSGANYHQAWTWQIFTAEELYDLGLYSGNIHAIGLQRTTTGNFTTPMQIYMAHIDTSAFANKDAYIPLNQMTKVFDGSYTFYSGEEWSMIPFSTPFAYDGAQNLVVAFYRNQEVTTSQNFKYTYELNVRAIYRYGSSTATLSPATSGSTTNLRNNMRFDMCTQIPTCLKPTLFAKNGNTGAYSIPLRGYCPSGAASIESIQVKLTENGTPIDIATFTNISNAEGGDTVFYSLTGLQADTTYTIWMRLKCSETDSSRWSTNSVVAQTKKDATDIVNMYIYQPTGAQIGATEIDKTNHTVHMVLNIDNATQINGLVMNFTLSNGAIAKVGNVQQQSGTTSNDFTNPVTYRILAEDTMVSQNWTVTVTVETCPAVKELDVTRVTSRSASLWCAARPTQNKWNVRLIKTTVPKDTSYSVIQRSVVSTYDSIINDTVYFTLPLVGYNDYTNYSFSVQADCGGGDTSFYYAEEYFSAPPTCYTPTNLAISDIQRRSATVSWTPAEASVRAWDVLITDTMNAAIWANCGVCWADSVMAHVAADRWTLATSVTDTFYNFTNLTRNTPYHVFVRTHCSEEDGNSLWQYKDFTTMPLDYCYTSGHRGGDGNLPVTNYNYAYAQLIYEASEIGSAMTLNSLFLDRSAADNTMNNMKIYLGHTTKATFANSSDWVPAADLTEVFSGSWSSGTAGMYEVIFSTPFEYNGTDNLVVAISNGHGNWNAIQSFYYTSKTGTVLYRRSDSDATYANHPGTLAGYGISPFRTDIKLCMTNEACPAIDVASLTGTLTGDGITTATISWTAPTASIDYPSGAYDIVVAPGPVTTFDNITTTNSYTYGTDTLVYANIAATSRNLSGLTAYTDYYVYVRVRCDQDPDQQASDWVGGFLFKTNSECRVPNNTAIVVTSQTTATATWSNGSTTQANNFSYLLTTSSTLDPASVPPTASGLTDTTVSLTALSPNTEYYFYVKNDCSPMGESPYVGPFTFQTPPTCPQPINLTATDISAYAATINWERGNFASETQWVVRYFKAVGTDSTGIFTDVTVNDLNQCLLLNLEADTVYKCYVKAVCGVGDESPWTGACTFTTAPPPQPCNIIADGTATNSNIPVYGYYLDVPQKTQMIYLDNELTALRGKELYKMTFYLSSSASAAWNGPITVSLGITSSGEGALSSGFVTADVQAFTDVYTGSLDGTGATMEITFATNFTYPATGGNLLLQFEQPVGGNWKQATFYGKSTSGVRSRKGQNTGYTSGVGTYSFLPKVDFCYPAPSCYDVTHLKVVGITSDAAHIQWHPGNTETSWNFAYSDHALSETEATAAAEVLAVPYKDLSGLTLDKTYYVYVQSDCGAGSLGSWVSSTFNTLPSCSQPTVAISDIQSDRATLTCTPGEYGTALTYDYQYWKEGGIDTIFIENEGSSVTLGGNTIAEDVALSAMTRYYYRVKVNCDGAEGCSRWTTPVSFVTGCGTYTSLPFNEGFEANSTTKDCWTMIDSDADGHGWATSTITAHTGIVGMISHSYEGDALTPDNWLISPAITITANQQLSWWRRTADPSYPAEHYSVYILNSNEVPAEIPASLYTESVTSSNYLWEQRIVKLRDYAGQTVYIAFRHHDCTDQYALLLDDIIIDDIPACSPPLNPVVNYRFPDKVNISWSQGDLETQWQVIASDSLLTLPTSFALYTPATANTNTGYNVTGLLVDSGYYIYIRSNCGSGLYSEWTDPLPVRTLCAKDTIPIIELLTPAGKPTCWQQQYVAAGKSGAYKDVLFNTEVCGIFNLPADSGAKTRLVSLPICSKDSANVQLSFYMRHLTKPAGSNSGVVIQYSENLADWTSIDTIMVDEGVEDMFKEHVILNNIFDDKNMFFIGFLFENDGTNMETVVKSPIKVEIMPNCAKPLALRAQDVTPETATLVWEGMIPSTSFVYYLSNTFTNRPDTLTPHSITPLITPGMFYQDLTGLTYNTQYYAWVRTVCGGTEYSEISEPCSFKTPCGVFTVTEATPFIENFNGITSGIPECWDNSEGTTTNLNYRWNYHASGYEGGCVRFNSFNNQYGTNLLKTCALDLSAVNNAKLEFYVKNPAGGNLDVLLSTDGGVTYPDTLFTGLNGITSWTLKMFDLTPYTGTGFDNVVIVFYSTSNWGYGDAYHYLDNVVVRITETNTDIASYTATTAEGVSNGDIDAANHTINVVLNYGYVAGANITPTITLAGSHATIAPASGTVFGWYTPSVTTDTTVVYTVTAENGDTQDWSVHFLVESCPSLDSVWHLQSSMDNIGFNAYYDATVTEWDWHLSETQKTQAELNALTNSNYTTITGFPFFITTTFDPETQYYIYIRSVCSATEKSTWYEYAFTTWMTCVEPTNIATEVINDTIIRITWTNPANLPIGMVTDDFNRADIVAGAPFVYDNTTSSYPWTLTTQNGKTCIKSSNAGVNSSLSTITLTHTVPMDSEISFEHMVFGESTSSFWDYLIFKIDATEYKITNRQPTSWTTATYPITAGEHTFSWTFTKDGSVAGPGDCAYITNITLPTIDGYIEIVRDGWTIATVPTYTNSYDDKVLTPGNYCYTLQTYCEMNNGSTISAPVCEETNNCYMVTDLTVSGITDDDASLSWTRGTTETAWNITINNTVVPITEITSGVTVNADTIVLVLDTLQSNTVYHVTVQTDCGSGVEGKSFAEIDFTTECGTLPLPYIEKFDSYVGKPYYQAGVLPDCWDAVYSGTNANYAPHIVNNFSSSSPNGIAIMASTNVAVGDTNYLVLPQFAPSDITITFKARMSEMGYGGTVHLGGMIYGTFYQLETLNLTEEWQTFTYTMQYMTDRLAFEYIHTENGYVDIYPIFDDIHVMCAEVTWVPEPTVCIYEGYDYINSTYPHVTIPYNQLAQIASGTGYYLEYRHFGNTVSGCDSVFKIEFLNVYKADSITVDSVVCGSGEYHFYNGDGTENLPFVNTSGTYVRNLYYSSYIGCDSVVTLHFTVQPEYTTPIVVSETICFGESYHFYGSLFDTTLHTAWSGVRNLGTMLGGCDSLVNLTLSVLDADIDTTWASICEGEVYNWTRHGVTVPVSTAGYSYDSVLNAYGCNDIAVLHLTIHPVYIENVSLDLCSYQLPYTWRGHTFPTGQISGVITYNETSSLGCDSTVILTLTVDEAPKVADAPVTLCSEDLPYLWRGKEIWSPGIHEKKVGTYTNGCDSIRTIEVTVFTTPYTELVATATGICRGTAVTINALTSVLREDFLSMGGANNGNQTTPAVLSNFPTLTRVFAAGGAVQLGNNTGIGTMTSIPMDLSHPFKVKIGGKGWLNANAILDVTVGATTKTVTLPQFTTWSNGAFTERVLSFDAATASSTITLATQAGSQRGFIDYVYIITTVNGAEVTYEWIGQSNNTNTITVTPDVTTTYQLRVASGSCADTVEKTILVSPAYPAGTIVFNDHLCQGLGLYAENDFSVTIPTTFVGDTTIVQSYTTTIGSCDSIRTLNLTVTPRYLTPSDTSEIAICDGETYSWHGGTYTAAGVYTKTLSTVAGCDSVVALKLTVKPAVTHNITAEACETYTWNGTTYTESGVYTKTYTAANGCDSTVTLTLTIHNAFDNDIALTECDSYTWDGTPYTESGVYTKNYTSIHGCDSVVTLTLTINASATNAFTAEACDSYTWDGDTYTTSGNHVKVYTAANGCDSTVTLTLTINASVTNAFTEVACDSYTWGDTTYTESGVYTKTYTAANGCDSTVTLNLTINVTPDMPTATTTENTVCTGTGDGTITVTAPLGTEYEYSIDGITYQTDVLFANITDGAYLLRVRRIGTTCVNSATVIVGTTVVRPDAAISSNSPLCEGAVLTLSGTGSATGANITYLWTGPNGFTATVMNPADITGVTVAHAGTYTLKVTDTNTGCDKSVSTVVVVNMPTTGTDVQTACDSYTWIDGVTYTVSTNTPIWTLTNAAGCDSVVTLNLTINYSVTNAFTATACDSYMWDGTEYTESGDYVKTFTAANGCDSTVTLTLTINQSSTGIDVQEHCDTYTWIDGNIYTESTNTPTHTLTAANGCDSVVTLHLTIKHSVTHSFSKTACDSYTWSGSTYTASGDYVKTYTAANGCDSVVTLHLTINATPIVPTATTTENTICSGTGNGTITVTAPLGTEYEYSINGITYQTDVLFANVTDGDYTLTVRRAGTTCTNTATITVGTTVVRPDAFISSNAPLCEGATLTLSGAGSATGADITYLWTGPNGFTTNVMNPADITNVTATHAGTYTLLVTNTSTGCDKLVSTIVTVMPSSIGVDVQEHCNSYTWIDGNTYTESTDTPTWTLVNAEGCDSVVTLNLTINHSNTGIDVQEHCDSYTWMDGNTYTESTNTPTWTLTNEAGCDSVVTLNLTINHSNTGIDVQEHCDSYTWIDGNTYTASTNTPIWTLTNAAGCDSVVTLNLTIKHSVTHAFTVVVCDSYTWDDTTYTESGDYVKTFTAANGCDSVVTLHLTINVTPDIPTATTTKNTICSGTGDGTITVTAPLGTEYEYSIDDGFTYQTDVLFANLTDGDYTLMVRRIGTTCANSATVTVGTTVVRPDAFISSNDPLCEGETLTLSGEGSATGANITYLWNGPNGFTATVMNPEDITGVTVAHAGTYTLLVTDNSTTCDKLVSTVVTVNTPNTGIDVQEHCDSYTWIDGITYTENTNTPTWTLTNAAGCDSVVTLNLTIKHSVTNAFTATDCDSYTWDGTEYTESGDYVKTFAAANGCDSVVTLTLTINHSNMIDTTVVACNSFTWYGVTYTETPSVAPTQNFTNEFGCDSIVTLNLTIYNDVTNDFTATACDSYMWDGVEYTVSGDYTNTYTTIHGCDSIVTLHLTINATPDLPTATTTENTICSGTGNGAITVTAPLGTEYEYSIDGITYQTDVLFANIMDGDYTLTVRRVGTTCTNSAIVTVGTTVVRPDAVISSNDPLCEGATLTLSGEGSAIGANITYLWTGPNGFNASVMNPADITNVTVAHAGTYTLTVTDINNGCDKSVSTVVTVIPSSTGIDVQEHCNSYTWIDGNTYTESTDTPTWTLVNAAGCDSVVTLNLTINPLPVVTISGITTIIIGESTTLTASGAATYLWSTGETTASITVSPTVETEYSVVGVDANGCEGEANVTVTVTDCPPAIANLTATACGSYMWYETEYTITGSYSHTVTGVAAGGCDSVYILDLTINPIPEITITGNLLIEEGESTTLTASGADTYLWSNGETTAAITVTPTETTVYSVTGTNEQGCSTTTEVTVRIKGDCETVYSEFTEVACNSYVWNDEIYVQSGDYEQTFLTEEGCDSIVTLRLTILPLPDVTLVGPSDICLGEVATLSVASNFHEYFEGLSGNSSDPYSCEHEVLPNDFSSFPIVNNVFEAGNAVKLGLSTRPGSMTSQPLDLSQPFTVTMNVKGWQRTMVSQHSYITVTVGNQVKTVEAPMFDTWQEGGFEEVSLYFNAETENATVTVATTQNGTRAFIESISVSVPVTTGLTYLWSNGATTSTIEVTPDVTSMYEVTVSDEHHCSITLSHEVTVHPTVTSEFAETACGRYVWNNEVYTESGVYTQVLQTAYGCDSIVTLTLTVNPMYHVTLTDGICAGEDYTLHGFNLTQPTSGVYVLNHTTIAGCDSTTVLYLTVSEPVVVEITETACDSYTWNSEVYTESGDYVQTFETVAGCDSVVTLHLTVNYGVVSEFTETACDSYIWNNAIYTESGDYVQTFTTATGCDSVVTLHLTVNYGVVSEFTETACGSYIWNDQVYTESGDYQQTFTTATGCDSVVTLHLTIGEAIAHSFSEIACESYEWNEISYTESGTYIHFFVSVSGCDSVVTLYLTVYHSGNYEFDVTACGSYTWNDQVYTESGNYVQTFSEIEGCDSVVTLHLTIIDVINTEFTETACGSYIWNNQIYTESGDYQQTFTTATGCDSIVTLHLTVGENITHSFSETACGSYEWNGVIYTQSGTYTQTFASAAGCDSIVTLHLTISQLPSITAIYGNVNMCQGESAAFRAVGTNATSYEWTVPEGFTIVSGAGTSLIVLKSDAVVSGVLSVHGVNACGVSAEETLFLSVNPTYTTTINAEICQNEVPYNENGFVVYHSGVYTKNLTSVSGCDSTVVLNLTVHPVTVTPLSVTICSGESYNFFGQILTTSGSYYHTLTSSTGCDSTIVLTLKVLQTPTVMIYGDTEICSGETILLTASGASTYQWSNGATGSSIAVTPTTTTTYTVTGTNSVGCSSTASITVVVHSTPATPTLTAVFNDINVQLSIGYSGNADGFVIYRNGVELVTLPGSTTTYIDNQVSPAQYYCYQVEVFAGICTSELSNEECGSINAIPETKSSSFNVYPNPANDFITIAGEDISSIELYNVAGQFIVSKVAEPAMTTQRLETKYYETGVYLVRIHTNSGAIITKRVVIAR